MIALRFINLENIINFDERYVNILEIADKELFKKIVFLINKYGNNIEEGNDVLLLENNIHIELSKASYIVNDYYNLDLNTNKILKALYKDIEMEYNLEYSDNDVINYLVKIFDNIQNVLNDYDFDFDFKRQLDIYDILKSIGLKFNSYYYDNPYKNLICLFDLIAMFKMYKIVILINAKIFLNEDEIISIYRAALQRDIRLLLLEYGEESKLLLYENKIYVDNDYDEFVLKQ